MPPTLYVGKWLWDFFIFLRIASSIWKDLNKFLIMKHISDICEKNSLETDLRDP